MKIQIQYDLGLSDEDIETLDRFWHVPVGEEELQAMMKTAGYRWIRRHIEECREQLEMEAVGGLKQ